MPMLHVMMSRAVMVRVVRDARGEIGPTGSALNEEKAVCEGWLGVRDDFRNWVVTAV